MPQDMREDGVMTVNKDNKVIVIYQYKENTILIALYSLIQPLQQA